MSVIAKLNYLRIAPRKVRQVSDLIRGKSVEEAQNILNFLTKKSALPLLKLLNSAIANAKNNFQLEESNLYISKITINEGPKLKRWRARARGVAAEIQKKTSHITIVLDEIVKRPKKVKKVKPKAIKRLRPTRRPRGPAELGGRREGWRPAERAPEKVEEKVVKLEKPPKEGKPPTGQARIRPEIEVSKPKIERGIKRIFRRKAF